MLKEKEQWILANRRKPVTWGNISEEGMPGYRTKGAAVEYLQPELSAEVKPRA